MFGYRSPVAMGGGFGGLSSPKQSSKAPILNMKHYKSMEFLLIFRMPSLLHKRKAWRLSGGSSGLQV